jgi:hypothetical protein
MANVTARAFVSFSQMLSGACETELLISITQSPRTDRRSVARFGPDFFGARGKWSRLCVFDPTDFGTEIYFHRFDLFAVSDKEFRVPERFAFVRLEVVENKGFVAVFEQLSYLNSPSSLAVWPTARQIGRSIDVVVVRAGKGKVQTDDRFQRRAVFGFVGPKVSAHEF